MHQESAVAFLDKQRETCCWLKLYMPYFLSKMKVFKTKTLIYCNNFATSYRSHKIKKKKKSWICLHSPLSNMPEQGRKQLALDPALVGGNSRLCLATQGITDISLCKPSDQYPPSLCPVHFTLDCRALAWGKQQKESFRQCQNESYNAPSC